jgi:hypothetical protein
LSWKTKVSRWFIGEYHRNSNKAHFSSLNFQADKNIDKTKNLALKGLLRGFFIMVLVQLILHPEASTVNVKDMTVVN